MMRMKSITEVDLMIKEEERLTSITQWAQNGLVSTTHTTLISSAAVIKERCGVQMLKDRSLEELQLKVITLPD